MSKGWIKIHRKIVEHPRFTDGEWLKIWVFLLCQATHTPIDRMFAGRRITLHPGQMITSRKSIARETKVNPSKVERVLEWMKSEQQIEQQADNRCRLISITCWSRYQESGQQSGQQADTKRTPTGHPPDTHKNIRTEEQEEMSVHTLDLGTLHQFADSEFPTLADRRSLAIEFHSIYAVQDWRTQGSNPINLLESGRWKHKFRSFVMQQGRATPNGQPKEKDYSPKKYL